MIFENAKPRLDDAIKLANSSKESQEVKFIYNELCDKEAMGPAFNYLFWEGVDYTTRHDEYRFVLIIHPKHD